jgi:hypothetical protein
VLFSTEKKKKERRRRKGEGGGRLTGYNLSITDKKLMTIIFH